MTSTVVGNTNPMEDTLPIGPFFRFPNKETGMTAIKAAGFTTMDEHGNEHILTDSHHHCLDVIGLLYEDGSYDPETSEVIEPPVLLQGFHVNYLGPLPDGWEQYVVRPEHPKRVFA